MTEIYMFMFQFGSKWTIMGIPILLIPQRNSNEKNHAGTNGRTLAAMIQTGTQSELTIAETIRILRKTHMQLRIAFPHNTVASFSTHFNKLGICNTNYIPSTHCKKLTCFPKGWI